MKNHSARTLPALQDFRAVMESAHMAILLSDANGHTFFANEAACKLFGYSHEALLQLRQDALFQGSIDCLRAFENGTEGQAFHGELTGIRQNGEPFPCEVFLVLFRDKEQNLQTSISIIDISKRVMAEQQASTSHQSLKLLLNNTEESYLLIDAGLHIQSFNETTARETKKNRGIDLQTGGSFLDLTTPQRRGAVQQLCQQVLEGHTRETEVEITRPTGEVVFLKTQFSPVRNEQGTITGILISSADITAQKMATSQLTITEQRWRFALEGSNQGVWDWNIETGEVYFSPSWKRVFGFGQNDPDLSIIEWEERIHPDDRALVLSDVKIHLGADDVLYQNEYRFRCNDGSYKWILSRGMLTEKAADGTARRMIGTHTDITERKNVEEHYRLLFDSNPLPMWTYDLETFAFLNVNEAAVRHYGYTKEEFLSMTAKEVRPKEDADWLERMNRQDKDKKTIRYTNVRHLKKNGDLIYVNVTANVVAINGRTAMLAIVEDVTEKRNAEKALKQAKEHYELLFYHNPLPSYIYDVHTLRIIEVNHAALTHYGYSKEAFLSLSTTDVWHKEDVLQLLKTLQERKKHPTIAYTNVRHRKRGGEIFFANVHSNHISLNDRDCRLVVVNDVTAIVTAQEALKKSNERFEYAAKASSEALWEWDIATNYVFNSPAYFDIFGYTGPDDYKLKDWGHYIHPDDKEATVTAFYEAIQDKNINRWMKEYRYRKADGSYAYVLDKVFILRDKGGKATKVIGALQDISYQKQAQLELEKSNERFLLAQRATSDAIWDWDLLTGELNWGEGIFSLFGHDEKNISIHRWLELVHPDDREEVDASINQALDSSHTSWRKEYRFQKRDGQYSYVLDRGFIVRDATGKAIRMIGALLDISAQKYQQQLTSLELKMYEFNVKKDKSLTDIVTQLVRGIEALHPQLKAAVLLTNDRGLQQPVISNSLPDGFLAALNEFPLPSIPSPLSKAMQLKQPLIIENLQAEPDWLLFGELARNYGIRSGWFVPLTGNNGHAIGTFAFYHQHPQKPSPLEWSTITKLRNLLRILIENHMSIEELERSNERFDMAMKATHDLIWDWDMASGKIYRDPYSMQAVMGLTDTSQSLSIEDWFQRIHPEDIESVKNAINDTLYIKQQGGFDVEYRFLTDEGIYTYLYDRGLLIQDSEGKPYRVIGAAQNITERKKLEQELIQKELERQNEISQASINTQEQERAEIGKELHDNVNQVLTTTKLYLDLALNNPELKDDLIEKSNKNVLYIINEIRQLSRSLMNPSIGDLGLVDAVSDLVESVNVAKKLKASFSTDRAIEKLLSDNQKLMVYRIVQEALNNAVKHANATKVLINLQYQNNGIDLTIKDDGRGFNTGLVKRGAGLNNIQNRVYLTNGTFVIESEPNKGCKLKINLPSNKSEKSPN